MVVAPGHHSTHPLRVRQSIAGCSWSAAGEGGGCRPLQIRWAMLDRALPVPPRPCRRVSTAWRQAAHDDGPADGHAAHGHGPAAAHDAAAAADGDGDGPATWRCAHGNGRGDRHAQLVPAGSDGSDGQSPEQPQPPPLPLLPQSRLAALPAAARRCGLAASPPPSRRPLLCSCWRRAGRCRSGSQ